MTDTEPTPDLPVEPPTEPAPDVAEPPAEGDEAEGEGAAEEEAGEAPEEPSEPQARALSEKQMEAIFDKLGREKDRHTKRLGEIMGDDVALLVECPLCDPAFPGFVMPTPETPQRFPAVRTFMGDAQPRELRPDPYSQPCDTCGGEGVCETPSRVQGKIEVVCLDCGGNGFLSVKRNVGPPPLPAPAPSPAFNGETTTASTPAMPQLSPQQLEEKRRAEAAGLIVLDMPRRA
jgi:hypothetical protein